MAADEPGQQLQLKRSQLLDKRHEQLDDKRRRIEVLTHELESVIAGKWPAPIADISVGNVVAIANSSAETSFSDSEASSSIVVSLPVSARKSARKMAKDPLAAAQGRKEAKVLGRIHELQTQGIWMSKKIKKLDMPAKPKTHWDFVVEEMNWLSGVIAQERKTKKLTCNKCAKMIKKHFTDKEAALVRAEKAHEQNLRKIAATYSREIRTFWGNIQKVFEFTVRKQIEAKQKQALGKKIAVRVAKREFILYFVLTDQHLNFIVEKTEKFSTMLTESMGADNASSRKTTPNVSDAEMDENDEYEPDENSDDDEGKCVI